MNSPVDSQQDWLWSQSVARSGYWQILVYLIKILFVPSLLLHHHHDHLSTYLPAPSSPSSDCCGTLRTLILSVPSPVTRTASSMLCCGSTNTHNDYDHVCTHVLASASLQCRIFILYFHSEHTVTRSDVAKNWGYHITYIIALLAVNTCTILCTIRNGDGVCVKWAVLLWNFSACASLLPAPVHQSIISSWFKVVSWFEVV